ncbi:unnamed protein product [Thlaspi arvense]|uniref:Gnk2-homologous domain-containing protein n=1 Tax=Thlaspi arvense TaxID=13288 RepID=A0AAU9RX85_THLAR|nr:unnamed protein product [Thlaspi arvense]
MYSSSSLSKRLILVPILAVMAIQLLFIRSVSSLNMTNAYLNHTCIESQGQYKPGSAFENNLKSIIISIATTSNNVAGYDTMSLIGSPEDTVSAIFQCRGDSYGPKCRDCYATALAGLRRRCPRYKGGVIWYDQCLLEISAVDSVGKIVYDNSFCMSNAQNVSDGEIKFDEIKSLVDNLTSLVITEKNNSNPTALYAAGEKTFGKEKLYGMVQCTKDLSPEACQECLGSKILRFQNCLFGKRGARVVGRSCNFRFEFYPFVTTKEGRNYLKS